ncbi:hypothetical protein L6164_017896 [Bauhinia variegata]|uniref:Uncharacterized protein n=1 Tax=Bauhinia variegata TaxID=167791 RepID=A0ACB9NAQ9_BAUVA|nr:hypothetical protein L6164_017896 [Bauhinia variegata]
MMGFGLNYPTWFLGILAISGIMQLWHDEQKLVVVAENCQEDIWGFNIECMYYFAKSEPLRDPNDRCCKVIQSANIPCCCRHLSDKLLFPPGKTYADMIDWPKVLHCMNYCGRPLPSGFKCGNFTGPQGAPPNSRYCVFQARQAQMALVSGRTSALNPNAPLFIPAALRQVEDFSPQWWELVKTSTWFRDYWLSQHKEEDFGASANDTSNDDIEDFLQESFDLGIEDEFHDLEHEFEQLVLSSEAQDYASHTVTNDGARPMEGLSKDAKALLKNLTVPTSPKERGLRSPVGTAVLHEKPAQHVNLKCAPRRIHQPR